MVTLDKSKKLPYKTYFYYFYSLTGSLIRLMKNSDETDYSLHDCTEIPKRVPKSKQIKKLIYYKDSPDFIDTEPCFCVSNYDPNYLFNKLEELLASPEETQKAIKFSKQTINDRQE